MSNLDVIKSWFREASLNARKGGKKDSAALWADGLTELERMEKTITDQQRFIAALESTIDTLHLKVKTLEAELVEYRDLVGTHEVKL